jgi:histidinol-phosphate aminotransferase
MTNFLNLTHLGIQSLKPYQPGKPISELKREIGIDNIIKLASNENPLGCSNKARQAIIETIDQINYYPDSSGYELKKSLSNHLKISSENIILANGSDCLIPLFMKCFAFLQNKNILFPEYSFISYKIHAQILAIPFKETNTINWRVDIDDLLEQQSADTALIFIANPNNPTGTCLDSKAIKHILSVINPNTFLVLDEAYYDYALSTDYPNSIELLAKHHNLIIMRTFSKAYGLAGLRTGYAIAHPSVCDIINRVLPPFSVNSLALAACEAAIQDIEFLQTTVTLNQQGMNYLRHEFEKLAISYIPSKGNFLTIYSTKEDLFNRLLKKGVIIRPLTPYNMPNHYRITIGTKEQNEKLIEELTIIYRS